MYDKLLSRLTGHLNENASVTISDESLACKANKGLFNNIDEDVHNHI